MIEKESKPRFSDSIVVSHKIPSGTLRFMLYNKTVDFWQNKSKVLNMDHLNAFMDKISVMFHIDKKLIKIPK